MRTFEVSIVDGKVWCDAVEVRVKRATKKKFRVRLEKEFAKDYELRLLVQDDPGDCLSMKRKRTDLVMLTDNNRSPGKIKFGIELVPLPNSTAEPPVTLDPIIDND